MNKVLKAIYIVKVIEIMGSMESRSHNIPQANLQFVPILHWVVNFVCCYGCVEVALFLSTFTPLESIMSGAIISFTVFLYFSMKEWRKMWEEREEEIRYLDIQAVYNDQHISKADMHKLAFSIKNRSSRLFRSYFIYLIPHTLFLVNFLSTN